MPFGVRDLGVINSDSSQLTQTLALNESDLI
jgi:hypothetical protein